VWDGTGFHSDRQSHVRQCNKPIEAGLIHTCTLCPVLQQHFPVVTASSVSRQGQGLFTCSTLHANDAGFQQAPWHKHAVHIRIARFSLQLSTPTS